MSVKTKSISVRDMVYTALFAAILCAVAPFSLAIGPIPLSFATLIIYLAAGALDWRYSAASVALYIMLGAIGLPVFSNFEGGFYKIAGFTGGFIIGYIPMALSTGLFINHFPEKNRLFFIGMAIGTILLYTCGVAWFMAQMDTSLAAALMACVVPFLFGDTVKIILASILIPPLRKAMRTGGSGHRH